MSLDGRGKVNRGRVDERGGVQDAEPVDRARLGGNENLVAPDAGWRELIRLSNGPLAKKCQPLPVRHGVIGLQGRAITGEIKRANDPYDATADG